MLSMSVKGKVTLEQALNVQRVYSFFNLSARCGWVVNATLQPLYPREIDPAVIEQEPRSAPGTVCTGAENLAPTGI